MKAIPVPCPLRPASGARFLLLTLPCGLAAGFLFELFFHTGKYVSFSSVGDHYSAIAFLFSDRFPWYLVTSPGDLIRWGHAAAALLAFSFFLMLPLYHGRLSVLIRITVIAAILIAVGTFIFRTGVEQCMKAYPEMLTERAGPPIGVQIYYLEQTYGHLYKWGLVFGFSTMSLLCVVLFRMPLPTPRWQAAVHLLPALPIIALLYYATSTAITNWYPYGYGNFRFDGLWHKSWQAAFLFVCIGVSQVWSDELLRLLGRKRSEEPTEDDQSPAFTKD